MRTEERCMASQLDKLNTMMRVCDIMGKSHISMIEDAFKELGNSLTLNEIYEFVDSRWNNSPNKNKIKSLLAKRPQFVSVETTYVSNQTGGRFQANVWEKI